MHNSYFFLKFLSAELNQQLTGWRLVSCFSQSKDELVIEFNKNGKSFFLKAHLHPEFCCLSFPASFHRARKNSVDLFPEIILKEVESVSQFKNERSFQIKLTDGLSLIFKMHGNRSNVLQTWNESAVNIFRNHQEADLHIVPNNLNREISWSLETVQQNEPNLKKTFFTLSQQNWEHLNELGFAKGDSEAKWKILQNLQIQLNKGDFYIIEKEAEIRLSLYPEGKILKQTKSAIEAINEFFFLRIQTDAFTIEKQKALGLIRERVKQVESYINKNQPLLNSLLNDAHYQLWGDLVMASMHQIQKGQEKVSLENFHEQGKFIDIKLKKDLTPQKNAEVFYRKARNQKIEIHKLTEALTEKQKQLESLQSIKNKIETSISLQDIRTEIERSGLSKTKQENIVRLPYREIEFKGFLIRIGKSAADNDELTLKYAHKDDLWLHAKDVAGSHVIIKQQSGKEFPKDVMERAAELAAFYSKRKGESLCPVAVTSKKFVRKRKGDAPGMVVVEKEKVVMVEPRE